jgi:leader peptidase (prepilin peptidase)/N-methyltransferase
MLIYPFIFFTGSLFGSFFYTLAVRYINESFKRDKLNALFSFSKCPVCGYKINPLHLIPVLGYLLLRGKCGRCGSPISKIYPLAEILYGALAFVIYSAFGQSLYTAVIFLIIGLSISISVIDIRIQIIPDSFVLIFFLLSIYPVMLNDSLKDNLYGLLLMGAFFIIVLLIFPGSFGGGDVKFALSIGILLGLESSIVALETALIAGSLIGIIYAIRFKRGLRSKIPFAPFLTFGLLVSLLYGREILSVYYRIVY